MADEVSDFWADTDWKTWGDIDTPFNRDEFPEDFLWTFCDRKGDQRDCTQGKRESHLDRSKKAGGEKPDRADLIPDETEEDDDGDE